MMLIVETTRPLILCVYLTDSLDRRHTRLICFSKFRDSGWDCKVSSTTPVPFGTVVQGEENTKLKIENPKSQLSSCCDMGGFLDDEEHNWLILGYYSCQKNVTHQDRISPPRLKLHQDCISSDWINLMGGIKRSLDASHFFYQQHCN